MARSLFVLTGAGISAESGLGTFRDTDGVWARFDPMRLATPEGFAADPVLVHAFYNQRRRDALRAAPNPAHIALAQLEAELTSRGDRLFLCTQNIDDLHERAGCRAVTHMHGELLRARCVACGTEPVWHDDLSEETACPACGQRGGMRPDVVWFGEMPKHLEAIDEALAEADLFVAIGTSGAVYPAAGFVQLARMAGARTVEINLEPTQGARLLDEGVYGPATEVVPAFCNAL